MGRLLVRVIAGFLSANYYHIAGVRCSDAYSNDAQQKNGTAVVFHNDDDDGDDKFKNDYVQMATRGGTRTIHRFDLYTENTIFM